MFEPTGMQDLDHGEGRLRDSFVFADQVRGYVCCGELATQGAGSGCIHEWLLHGQWLGCGRSLTRVDEFSRLQGMTFQKLDGADEGEDHG
jgi:hypothetical protein